MRMNFEVLDLRALMAVLELGSFSLAAARLHLSQPALSRRIQRLEATIGGALLERSTRHVAPSALGRQVLPLLRHALEEMEQALEGIADLGGADRGLVTLACIQTAVARFLPPALAAFRQSHPRTRVRVLDMTAQDCLQSLARGEADLALTIAAPLPEAELAVEPLLQDPFVLACHESHPLAGREALRWQELADQSVILAARTSLHRVLIQDALARQGQRLGWHYEVLHMASALHLVRAGLGVSVLPRLAMAGVAEPGLRAIPLVDPVVRRPLSLVWRRARPLPPPAAHFCQLLRQVARQGGG